jgi:hypothetical protein
MITDLITNSKILWARRKTGHSFFMMYFAVGTLLHYNTSLYTLMKIFGGSKNLKI